MAQFIEKGKGRTGNNRCHGEHQSDKDRQPLPQHQDQQHDGVEFLAIRPEA